MKKTFPLIASNRDFDSVDGSIGLCGSTFIQYFPDAGTVDNGKTVNLTVSTKRQRKRGERKVTLLPFPARAIGVPFVRIGGNNVQLLHRTYETAKQFNRSVLYVRVTIPKETA